MDAYSVSYTSPSRRNSSRIYQDLKTIRLQSLVQLEPEQLVRSLQILQQTGDVSPLDSGEKPHVGVIGAGLSGLRCADLLLQYGFDVTILEGRDRVGGRLHQETLSNGHLIDVGANWIHGTSSNPILDLAKRTKTAIGSWDTKPYIYDEDGELFPIDDGEDYSAIMWDIILDAFKHSEKHCQDIDPKESLLDFFHSRIDEVVPETQPNYKRTREIVMHMAELWGAFVGSPISRQSLKFFWLEECLEGENLFCAGTYQKILHEVAKPAMEGAAVKLNTKITKIHGRSVGGKQVQLESSDGQTFDFDEVVVTAPLGWLKQNLDAFNPPLPDRLTRGIQSIGYGCLEKVYITFPEAFWTKPIADGRMVQGFCQWLAPKYAVGMNPKRWTHEVVELASLTPATSQPSLLFYIYGEESQLITSSVRSLGPKEKHDFICAFFKPYYSRLPHFDEDDPKCQPTGSFTTDWLHDDLAGNGSYSNFQVGLTEGDKDIRAMREGVPSEGIWLAGEHTAPFVALGTVTGAYWSGESVGRRIAEAYGKSKGMSADTASCVA
ncbi:FAD/NAD(P)-binding domain-containing protein [Coniochaeta hoffmannii]|uniref:FAD/NAD(P)-binding domain-containing protein n=1 Tax=Coniochaeta hoffmannii TaxID=91930 RepID=A0AA38VAZ6_9PEZI|nr:FAD/NAD(P)-binding domain-containing protein [Coniochaeta hoffmannii]